MQNSKILNLINIDSKNEQITSKMIDKEYKIYTPDMVKKYKYCFKTIFKISKDRDKTIFIMYEKVDKWYKSKKNLNLDLEKIHIKAKLGSYLSGGCGIRASFLASFIASGAFSYMNNYLRRLEPISLICYGFTLACLGIILLTNEDNQVEMYNIFLDVLNKLENDKKL